MSWLWTIIAGAIIGMIAGAVTGENGAVFLILSQVSLVRRLANAFFRHGVVQRLEGCICCLRLSGRLFL